MALLAVVVDDQDPPARQIEARLVERSGRLVRQVERGLAATGRRTTNSLPWPGPALWARHAAAVHLDQRPDQGQADPQSAPRPRQGSDRPG